jgi:hypothetical protein
VPAPISFVISDSPQFFSRGTNKNIFFLIILKFLRGKDVMIKMPTPARKSRYDVPFPTHGIIIGCAVLGVCADLLDLNRLLV